MKLTASQRKFLAHHNILDEETFDASGLPRRVYKPAMKTAGKLVCYSVTPCREGHSLRSRHGTCIQCFPASLAFMRRNASESFVYIAGSMTARLIKVGMSNDPTNRLYIANLENYGGACDWRLLAHVWVHDPMNVEGAVHRQLSNQSAPMSFYRDMRQSKECFQCSYSDAHLALLQVLPNASDEIYSVSSAADYDFSEKKRVRRARRTG